MATNMTATEATPATESAPAAPNMLANEQLHCALTGKPITADEAYWAPPLITARELVTTVVKTALHAPTALGPVLMADQPNVPYAQDARDQLAARRGSEQAKLLLILLVVLAILITPILLFVL